ncbi:methyltransferase-like protein 13 [Herrania umbratica]|uniref:Methyltransferase-like protein 13 n=1 Tax=Herrania umbratica TaxID=108875 RepID=A0A6J1B9E4_9ROSI|nr:methyltransferase-like protein 13 [Herrania umbratica]XP_021295800.1 methyltransferase-like protein 13 [Herrania umbratica]XP_021295801.1 methyltransferase-like protein 13 [Herrania umbratica]XP_021295802.1 methyltransferase-like protein 13 [Herrania umbratica]XP_021295803.1 methyltransferase-like protein 13 [Herrania umbratica]
MALDISIFETIHPSRFLSFTIPNPDPSHSSPLIRIAILDSPLQPPTPSSSSLSAPNVAAMFVPKHRESDWLFSTESGHLQLLLSSPNIQRLILIGQQAIVDDPNSPSIYRRPIDSDCLNNLEMTLKPLVIALSPKDYFKYGNLEVPILSYEDNVISSLVLEKCVGNFVGEMLVEDVEIESTNQKREFRRRLRFKRMPNLVQTEIRIVPKTVHCLDSVEIGGNNNIEFSPDLGVLVHVYLVPMVASLALVGSWIDERFQVGFRPKALCLGVGGGAVVGFLKTQLDFQVVGVEADKEVLRVAQKYFGLEDGDFIQICVRDGMELMEKLACGDSYCEGVGHIEPQFDVIMVDLDSSDLRNGVSAPPLEFVRKDVLLAARSILCESGIFVINVIPPSRLFYERLVHDFREVFPELYEIDVGNGENFVLIAKALPTASSISDCENNFLKKLRLAISGAYMESMKRI